MASQKGVEMSSLKYIAVGKCFTPEIVGEPCFASGYITPQNLEKWHLRQCCFRLNPEWDSALCKEIYTGENYRLGFCPSHSGTCDLQSDFKKRFRKVPQQQSMQSMGIGEQKRLARMQQQQQSAAAAEAFLANRQKRNCRAWSFGACRNINSCSYEHPLPAPLCRSSSSRDNPTMCRLGEHCPYADHRELRDSGGYVGPSAPVVGSSSVAASSSAAAELSAAAGSSTAAGSSAVAGSAAAGSSFVQQVAQQHATQQADSSAFDGISPYPLDGSKI